MEKCEILLEKYNNLISSKARKYRIYGYEYDDILQEFRMLFFNACQKYDEKRGVKLTTLFHIYVNGWIRYILERVNAEKRVKPFLVEFEEINKFFISQEQTPEDVFNEEISMSMFDHIANLDITYDHIVNGKTLTDIAKEKAMSVQAVHVKHNKVLDKIKELIQEEQK